MKSTILHFELTVPYDPSIEHWEMATAREFSRRFRPALNRTTWQGKDPRTCCVLKAASRSRPMGDTTPMIVDVQVGYRPKGYVSYTGNTRYDGWTAMLLERSNEGVLLAADGSPLQDGNPPVYSPKEVYGDAEFNDIDFGTLVRESDVEDVKHRTIEEALSGLDARRGGLHQNFMAARRSRPLRKIVLSNSPSQQWRGGFHEEVRNINLSTPHLEQVMMDELTHLMCDFLEGKASIKAIGNDEGMFVALSDSLVDCEPNELGLDSWFDVMHYYTPIGFLEDLAKRLMAVYKVKVEVVDGKGGGLVLKHDK